MDGIHDLGGKPGYGKIDRSGEDEVFHDRWEAVVFAMSRAGSAAGAWHNVDRFRHAVERVDPATYLAHGYYGRWLGGIETLLVEAGIVTSEEVNDRVVEKGGSLDDPVCARPLVQPDPLGPLPLNQHCDRALDRSPKFRVGDRIRTLATPVPGHTRLPAYARDKVGEITCCHEGWVYPDTNAHGAGEQPQYLYTVTFSSDTLWNQQENFSVSLDLFEPYMQEVNQ
jgi:nitrile hydratase